MRQFIPPSLVLALAPVAGVMRLMRSSILETTRQDYIRTAHAKGLPERMVLYRHALKNSLIPVVTVMGLQVANLLSGSVVVEQVFNLRGVGQYLYTSILQKDYLVAQNLVLYVAATVVGMNLLVDILYSYLDPRIRYE
jgi:peptide/nickel transport system permease protein